MVDIDICNGCIKKSVCKYYSDVLKLKEKLESENLKVALVITCPEYRKRGIVFT